MIDILLAIIIILVVANIFIALIKGKPQTSSLPQEFYTSIEKIGTLIRDEFSRNREESNRMAKETREELSNSFKLFGETVNKNVVYLSNQQKGQLDSFSIQLQTLTKANEEKIEKLISLNETKQNEFKSHLTSSLKETKDELSKATQENRTELTNSLKAFGEAISKNVVDLTNQQKSQLESFSTQLQTLTKANEEKIEKLISLNETKQNEFKEHLVNSLKETKDEINKASKDSRSELTNSLKSFEERFSQNVKDFNELQRQKFNDLSVMLEQLKVNNEEKLEKIRDTIEKKLQTLQEENGKKLEEMRNTVDEKLQSTVEKRFNESFKIISDRLEQVHKGLGEMQTLASGVGDLKKVLTNVKTRGSLGEIQLGNILEQILSSEQYDKNVIVKAGSQERVEFAVKLPGKNDDNQPLYLPIDSKFPNEDYQRLIEAYDNIVNLDPKLIETASKQFENAVKKNAKDIRDKYINPPATTDFAIMFVPTEALYAEILRRTGLFETLQ